MAKKYSRHKKTKFDIVNEKLETILSWPVNLIFRIVFGIIAFIFWRNKYSKRYWTKRREWRKTMLRLRSRAQKDIILTAVVPELERQGFEREPFPSWWGWNYCIQGYEYVLIRLKDEELQKFEISTYYGHSYFQINLSVYKLKPNISDISELAIYDGLFDYPECNKPSVSESFIKYKLKSFSSENELEKKKIKLKRKFEKWLSNIDNEFIDWHKNHTPAIIDTKQKLKEKQERDNADLQR